MPLGCQLDEDVGGSLLPGLLLDTGGGVQEEVLQHQVVEQLDSGGWRGLGLGWLTMVESMDLVSPAILMSHRAMACRGNRGHGVEEWVTWHMSSLWPGSSSSMGSSPWPVVSSWLSYSWSVSSSWWSAMWSATSPSRLTAPFSWLLVRWRREEGAACLPGGVVGHPLVHHVAGPQAQGLQHFDDLGRSVGRGGRDGG